MSEGTGAPAVDVSQELARRLHEVGRAVSPSEIGELWIFPPLSDLEESAEFVLFTQMLEEDRRRLFSTRLRRLAAGEELDPPGNGNGNGGANGKGTGAAGHGEGSPPRKHEITEHGSVPADSVHRLIERFRRRLGQGGEPVHLVIGGSVERWSSLLPGPHADGSGHARGNGRGPADPADA